MMKRSEIEGKLVALEEKIEFLQPSGPYVRIGCHIRCCVIRMGMIRG